MNNRLHIMKCALRLFSENGYDAVGIKEITEKSGITKPTLYYYFGSKLGLLETIVRENYMQMEKLIRNASEYNGDVSLTLYKIVLAYFNYAKNNIDFYRFFMSIVFAPPQSEAYKTAKPILDNQLKILEDMFEKTSDINGNINGRQKLYAISFYSIINTYIFHQELNIKDDDVSKLLHQFMYGIYS